MRPQLGLILLLAATLAACATTTPVRPGSSSSAPSSSSSVPRAGTAASAGAGARLPEQPTAASGATAALLTQSHGQREAGDLGGAAATVERALTIAPDDALLWVELAEIRMNQGDAALAEEMARKALTLTAANTALAERARRLLRR